MTHSHQSDEPFTESLRSDVLLLSTYLSGQQTTSFRSSSVVENMDLFVDISTLLAIGNNHNHSAVMGKATLNSIEFLVCAIDATRPLETALVVDGMGGYSGGSAERKPIVKEDDERSAGDVGDLVGVTPSKESRRKLLDHLDLERSIDAGVELSK